MKNPFAGKIGGGKQRQFETIDTIETVAQHATEIKYRKSLRNWVRRSYKYELYYMTETNYKSS